MYVCKKCLEGKRFGGNVWENVLREKYNGICRKGMNLEKKCLVGEVFKIKCSRGNVLDPLQFIEVTNIICDLSLDAITRSFSKQSLVI